MSETAPPLLLIVDDEEAIRTSFRNYLEDYDYRILEAENGRVGLFFFERHKPDILLVDLRMPEMDGLEVLAQVTRLSPDTPVVVVSGTGVIADVVQALRLGAWDYLLKPVEDLSLLRIAVEKALEKRGLIRQSRRYQTSLEEEVARKTERLRLANERIKTATLETIFRLCRSMEYRDKGTGDHIQRMSYYASSVARKLGLDEEFIETLLYAAPMHDVGKIGIPDRILLKPAPLDDEEWAIMRTHTRIGSEILAGSQTPIIQCAERIAAHHHERWDGTGYPDGLKGEEIPIEARIVAVVDVFDALCQTRPYKDEIAFDECMAIIRASSGTHFDPRVVEAFEQTLERIEALRDPDAALFRVDAPRQP